MALFTRSRRLIEELIRERPRGGPRRTRDRRPGRVLGELLEDRVLLSHFRYGNLSWEPVAGQTNTVDFHFQFAARIDSSSRGSAIQVGDIVTDTTGGNPSFNFGDGTSTSGVFFRVTSLTSTYYTAQAVQSNSPNAPEGLIHTYSRAGNFTANYTTSARLSTLKNDANGTYQLQTIVNVGSGNNSPVSSIPAVVQVPDNQIFTFQVPAIDPDGDTLVYRLATSLEASGSTSGYTQPPNLSISQTGVITWDVRDNVTNTVPNDLWTAQVVVEDHDPTSGALKSKIPLDFILQIVGPQAQPPVFDSAPSTVLTPVAGQTLTFVVQASDPNPSNSVMLQALNPPQGMTFTNVATSPGSRANAVAIQASFTPTALQAGQTFVISFLATNSQSLTAQTQVTISPMSSPAPTVVTAQVNDGSAQRSLVQSLQLTFSKLVTISPGAFVLTTPSGVQPVTISSTTTTVNNQTVATLTFSGPGIVNNSLEDGRYKLTVLSSKVSDSLGQNLPNDFTYDFFRFFGDTDGNGVVDNLDAYALRTTYNLVASQGAFLAYLDFNGDGKVDASDRAQFVSRYTRTI